jgi:hypothetical protein
VHATIAALAAALLQGAAVAPPDLSQLSDFATIERKPSWEDRIRVRVGTFGGMETDPGSTYWFTREIEDKAEHIGGLAWTNTDACPAALPVLKRLERLKMPQPDVPGFGRDANIIIMDGASYRLSGIARHADGQPGDYSIESNRHSPLARWADKLFQVLEKCWKPL